jgi:hypothetical protein
MFSKEEFLTALTTQCRTFNLLPGQVWQIAENVFAVMVREMGGGIKWNVIYYFDDREVKLRDKDSHEECMAREVQLMKIGGFTFGAISEDSNDHVRIAYFDDDPTGYDPKGVVNCASQLFAKTNNDEVAWLDSAELIPFSIIGK